MNIYWSNIEDFNELNWSILYREPVSVYQDLLKNKSNENNSFFKCPSFIETTKNIFMIRSPLSCSYSFYKNKKNINISPGSLQAEINHDPSINNNILFEINLWDNVSNFFIEENEPLAYFNFLTEEKINLKRFQITDNLKKIAKTISTSSGWEPKVSLKKRYERFKDSKLKDIILNEIRKNII